MRPVKSMMRCFRFVLLDWGLVKPRPSRLRRLPPGTVRRGLMRRPVQRRFRRVPLPRLLVER
jgi:hypothetical protein